MKRLFSNTILCFGFVGAVLASGCGGDGDGGGNNVSLVEDFSACGGDPAGNWTVQSSGFVGNPADDIEGCTTATADIDATQSGTVSLNADMTFSSNIATTGSVTITVPASCLPEQITSCDVFEEEGEDLTCSGDVSSACTCSESITETDSATGTWSTIGNVMTVVVAGEDDDVFEYCVDGDTLTILQDDDDGTTSAIRFTR